MLKFNPISNLRASVSENPYHNQHNEEITECIDDTVFDLQTYYDSILLMM